MSIEEKLSAPFDVTDIEWRIQQSGVKNGKPWAMVLAYVTNRAIQQRLDEVFGVFGWQNQYQQAPDGGVMCGISILDPESPNVDWITKWDGAENTNIDAVKGGLSGSMKRAAVQWGIGRYLYNLDVVFVECMDGNKGKNRGSAKDKQNGGKDVYFSWNAPKLPEWALPGEVKQPEQNDKVLEAENNRVQLYAAVLIEAKTLEELKDVWGDIPKHLQAQLKATKETAKKQLMGAAYIESKYKQLTGVRNV